MNEHLYNMLTVAEAMSASMHWNFLAQYSILKEMLADLHAIAGDNTTSKDGPDRREVGGWGHHHH